MILKNFYKDFKILTFFKKKYFLIFLLLNTDNKNITTKINKNYFKKYQLYTFIDF